MLALPFALAADPHAAVVAAVAQRVGVPASRVELGPLGLPEGVTANAWTVDLPRVGPVCGSAVTLILRGDGNRYTIRPRIEAWLDVEVATADAESGTRVATETARAACTRLRGETPVGAGEWQALARLRAGDPVTSARVRRMPDVLEGAEVIVVAEVGAVAVRAPGRATDDAYVGEPVHVVNNVTNTMVVGTLADDGTVRIGRGP